MHLFRNLTFWVLIAITAGILLGHYNPDAGVAMQLLGKGFITIIKLFINPIIFITIVLGITGMDSMKKVGRVGGIALLYFEIVTTLALVIGIIVGYFVEPGLNVSATNTSSKVIESIKVDTNKGIDWLAFFRENITIQVLLLSILTGLILNHFSESKNKVTAVISIASRYIFDILHGVMMLSPIGAFGGMAFTIGKYGLAALVPLAKLMFSVYLTMFFFIVFVLGGILKYYQISIWKFLSYIKQELLVVLGTSSSEAALPTLMNKLEKMGCHKSVVGLVVPTGYSFNLDGTSIYLSMAIIFLAQVFGIDLNFTQILTIIGVLMVTSKGAAGVTGSGFVILASTLSAVKVFPNQTEGLALLIGVDRFMSEARAITNFIGNGVATIAISNMENMFEREKLEKEFTN
ncbi:MAG: cation:dicarboxylate symporter family transporter [Sphingobacteriales bacterium]|jgi:aerobic C4-dicarboxylate transport protein